MDCNPTLQRLFHRNNGKRYLYSKWVQKWGYITKPRRNERVATQRIEENMAKVAKEIWIFNQNLKSMLLCCSTIFFILFSCETAFRFHHKFKKFNIPVKNILKYGICLTP